MIDGPTSTAFSELIYTISGLERIRTTILLERMEEDSLSTCKMELAWKQGEIPKPIKNLLEHVVPGKRRSVRRSIKVRKSQTLGPKAKVH
jgi:hypothetical protein